MNALGKHSLLELKDCDRGVLNDLSFLRGLLPAAASEAGATVLGGSFHQFQPHCTVCMTPSKTFNLAGLGASSIIIPNTKLRDRFNAARAGIMPRPNILGFVPSRSYFHTT